MWVDAGRAWRRWGLVGVWRSSITRLTNPTSCRWVEATALQSSTKLATREDGGRDRKMAGYVPVHTLFIYFSFTVGVYVYFIDFFTGWIFPCRLRPRRRLKRNSGVLLEIFCDSTQTEQVPGACPDCVCLWRHTRDGLRNRWARLTALRRSLWWFPPCLCFSARKVTTYAKFCSECQSAYSMKTTSCMHSNWF